MEEIWKDIAGYEGLYQVSNLGRVKNIKSGIILKPAKNSAGYLHVHLTGNKHYYLHRLVALAFIPNPHNYPEVNHKDENKENNCVDNLEWADRKYNCNYGTRNEKMANSLTNHKERSKAVIQYSSKGEFVKQYPSIKEAERQTGINNSWIVRCLKGKRKSTYGFIWRYAD